MKRKLLALLICLQIILSAFVPIFTTVAATEGDTGSSDTGSGTTVTSSVTSIFPDSKLTWLSYSDYLLDQATNAWNDPKMYVGYEVQFLDCYTSAELRNGFGAGSSSIFPSLYFGVEEETRDVNTIDLTTVKLVVDDYYYDEDTEWLWYKVKAADGYELPEILEQYPYVYYVNCDDLENGYFDSYPPALNFGPLKGIFRGNNTVYIKKQNVAASAMTEVAISDLPAIFDITPAYGYGWSDFYIGDIASEYTTYQYVSVDDIIIIPADATIAYEALTKTEDTVDYYACLYEIPKGVLELLSDKHKAELDKYIEHLVSLEQVEKSTTVNIGGIDVPISVTGKLPDDVSLHAAPVTTETVISEGFKLKDPADLVVALDIKLLYDEDGTEWQPKEGRRVFVSIGITALGYEENDVFAMQHKHGETIEKFDIVVVEDGYLTIATAGFSIFTVNSVTATGTNGTRINDGGTATLEVGQEVIYYFNRMQNNTDNSAHRTQPTIGTWSVTDSDGAIYYTVHANTTNVASSGVNARWIKINALKVTKSDITLVFEGRNNNTTIKETYKIKVVTPKAKANEYNGRKLYIIDTVNTTGNITAALVDTNGNALSLEGAAFSWKREDDINGEYFINPETFSKDYSSVNIALDHGGLVEARKYEDGSGFAPTTYTVTAILSDGTSIPASYTVYYQSEIINSGFEFPGTTGSSNYFFFPNGWPELYWKTTAPGTGSNITKDIEYGFYEDRNAETTWGPTQSADDAEGGKYFAEINAEEFGCLYQDIVTVPGEDIEWGFSHAPRQNPSANERLTNSMFIVIGATEAAQKLTQAQIEALGAQAKSEAGDGNTAFLTGQIPEVVEYTNTTTRETATYYVWYHDAGTVTNGNNRPEYNQNNNFGWTALEGSYLVPNGQYRTRLFFVTEKRSESSHQNYGNLIDAAIGGQYKKYLIEYYLTTTEHHDGGAHTESTVHKVGYDEEGLALIYSSQELKYLNGFIEDDHEYLHKILVNGTNYPYSVRYENDKGSLYIQKYARDPNFDKEGKYAEYDVVMQIYLRKVVVSVETEIEFPSTLTAEQKLSIIQNQVEKDGGYKSFVTLTSVNSGSYSYSATDNVLIAQRDPAGNYMGHFSVETSPEVGYTYRAEQTDITELPGLYLARSEIVAKVYVMGELKYEIEGDANSVQFTLSNADQSSSAPKNVFVDVLIKNVYAEKMTTIYYKGVGNGKVSFIGSGGVFEDTPTEELAYYSGKAIGAAIHPGAGAVFAGWYTNPECTVEVTARDGVWDRTTNTFKPNANILNDTSVTFYAKFQSGTIEIRRTNANPGQVFVYYVESADGKIKLYVPLVCDENGNGVAYVLEVPLQKYTVTELEDWSWRNPGEAIEQTGNDTHQNIVFTFDTPVSKDEWLNGYDDPKENVYN